MHFLLPDAILRGAEIVTGHGVLVSDGRIAAVGEPGIVPDGVGIEPLRGLLAPGYVEIQINGCGGVIFTGDPTVPAIERMDDVLVAHGVTSFLPTLITSPAEVISAGVAATRAAMARRPSVLGMHLEGPHISLAKAGTHDRGQIRPMSDADLRAIVAAADAIRLLTFAPESVAPGQIGRLAATGMTLALGHTAASAADILAAHAAGAHMLTHLYNGMPPLAGREPGAVGAALASDTLAASIIADGIHVDETSVRAAARAMGERLMLTSDATASIEGGDAPFEFGGYRCRIENGVVRNDVGALAGAAVLLDEVVRRMARILDDKARAIRMGSEIPARILGLDGELGRLDAGLRADVVLLDADDLAVRRVWRAGREVDRTAASAAWPDVHQQERLT